MKVIVVSDSLGETAEWVARAAASQFNGGNVAIQRMPHVDDENSVRAVLQMAAAEGAAVVYTLIRPELRRFLGQEAERLHLPAADVMGPVMEALARVSPTPPKLQPGLVHKLDAEYFQRVEAIEFAVKYDDGKDPRGALRADIILLGVSRTSKTPVTMYLAHRGYKVANVPLVPEVPVPQGLERVVAKVVGLTIRPDKLREIRQERMRVLGLEPSASYGDLDRINEELRYAQQVYRELGCPVIDVSNKAVEETANEVLQVLKRKGG